MKKLLLLSLVALFSAAIARAEATRADFVDRVATCEAIFQEFTKDRDPERIPPSVLKNAKAIVIVNQFKAGFILGVKDGYGVILVKKPDGTWSLPVLINAGEASLGLQVGANSAESVYVINDANIPRLLFKQRFNVGVDAKAVAGPRLAETEKFSAEILAAPVIIYTKSKGLYAGATVKAGHLSRNDSANFVLYNTKYTMPELLYSDWVQPPEEVKYIMNLVTKATQ